jgi:ParB/Sulfiredoxin domain
MLNKFVNKSSDRSVNSFTFEDALLAQKDGSLAEWVQAFLHKEGNIHLAEKLVHSDGMLIELVNIPLEILNKIDGPEPVGHRESLSVWDDRVSRLALKIKEGYTPPPLIVTDFWKTMEIVDGNHRHEALLRNDIKSYWTIFFLKNDSDKKLLSHYIKHR